MQNLGVLAAGTENGFIIPHDINEVIWGSSAFIVVMSLLIWKAGPAIKNMWNGRIDRIAGEIETAEAARRAAEGELADVQGRIANADAERDRIRAEAQQTAAALKGQIAERSAQDAADLRARVAVDAESSKAQATADLRAEMVDLAVGAAEAVVSRNLDDSTQSRLVESYIADLASGAGAR
jgi:F-type H+-transporting ATPase subunit b